MLSGCGRMSSFKRVSMLAPTGGPNRGRCSTSIPSFPLTDYRNTPDSTQPHTAESAGTRRQIQKLECLDQKRLEGSSLAEREGPVQPVVELSVRVDAQAVVDGRGEVGGRGRVAGWVGRVTVT